MDQISHSKPYLRCCLPVLVLNQKPMTPRTVKPQWLHVLLGEIRQCMCLFCDSVFASQIGSSFSVSI